MKTPSFLFLQLTLTFFLAFAHYSCYAYKTTTITVTLDDDNGVVPLFDGLSDNGVVPLFDGLSDNGVVPLFDGLSDNGVVPLFDGLSDAKGSAKKCDRQISIEQLDHCQMHLTQWTYKLRLAVGNPNPRQQEHLQQCCQQLREVDNKCRCEAVQKVLDQARLQQSGGQQQQMVQKAQMLPNDCNLKIQQCTIRV
ncbi:hypothetical protein R6Q59_015386 [Mikania micrantha]